MSDNGESAVTKVRAAESHADAIFDVLARDPRPRLSKEALMDEAGLTRGQFERGWSELRSELGPHVTVVEPRRHLTVYYLSDDFDAGTMYLYWLGKHLYTRVKSSRSLAGRMREVAAGDPELIDTLTEMEGSLSGLWASARQTIRLVSKRLDVPEEELAKLLA